MEGQTAPNPDRRRPASRIPGILLRLILVLIAGIAVGSLIYFFASGWIPYLDERVFQPIENNRMADQSLISTQQALASQISSLDEVVNAEQDQEYLALLGTVSAIEQAIAGLADQASQLQGDLQANTYQAGTLIPGQLATISSQQASNTGFISALATAQMAGSGLRQEIDLLRAVELLSRANQFLLHSNYGQAEAEVSTAIQVLQGMRNYLPPGQLALIDELLPLLEEILIELPSRPELAEAKLELAWQVAINGFPDPPWLRGSGTISPTPYITPSSTPTITSTPTPTPN